MNLILWDIDIHVKYKGDEYVNLARRYLRHHRNCLVNLFVGEKYRTTDGHVFTYRAYVPYYTAALPEQSGYEIDVKYWYRRPITRVNSMAIWMVNNPAFVWENGKKKGLTSKRDAEEYAKRNNLVLGGDDLEQESARNRINIDKEKNEKITNEVMEKFKYMQFVKSQQSSNRF